MRVPIGSSISYRDKPAAAWLLLPYLVWVNLAAALHLSIWRHNP